MTRWRPASSHPVISLSGCLSAQNLNMDNLSLNMDNFSDTISTTVMKLGQLVVCYRIFLNMRVKITLTQRPRSQETYNHEKVKMHEFTTTFHTIVMKVVIYLACDKTFEYM